MSKKQSDDDILAQLQKMLGGRGVKDAVPDSGDGASGSGEGGGADDGSPSEGPQSDGQADSQEQCATAARDQVAADAQEDEWDDDELEQRDAEFVAFLQQCENELNASGANAPRAL